MTANPLDQIFDLHISAQADRTAIVRFKSNSHQEGQIRQLLTQKGISNYAQRELTSKNTLIGSGMIGELEEEMEELAFLAFLKKQMQAEVVKHTALRGRPIKKVALCGGSGGFLLSKAIRQGADIFITSDYKYHEFFDAEGKIIIADIGHYESEQFTIPLLHEIISNKFTNFAVYETAYRTNPVSYFV